MTKLRRFLFIVIALLLILFGAFFVYFSIYYHATEEAHAALKSDERVKVSQTNYGWFFDGPSDRDALIFTPVPRWRRRPMRRCFISWRTKAWMSAW